MNTVAHDADMLFTSIEGQQIAEQFLDDLFTLHLGGDELFFLVSKHLDCVRSSSETAFLRSLLRRIQKQLERSTR